MKNHERVINSINNNKEAERQAIRHHIEAFKALALVIHDFDGKVINQRFVNTAKEQTKWYYGLDNDSVTSHTNETFKTSKGSIYPSFFRSSSFRMILNEGKRLNATATLAKLSDHIDYLEQQYQAHEPDNQLALAYITEMEELNRKISELKRSSDYITRELTRNMFPYIK